MTHSPRPWTEGEWTFRPDELIDGDWIVGVNGNEIIEICNASEADVRVMVAAPDMAEALAGLLAVAEMTTFSDHYPAECEAAREALSKAQATSEGGAE